MSVPDIVIPKARREELAITLNVDLSEAQSQRHNKIKTLDYWNDMFEMNIGERDEPWPNASNVCVPLVHIMHMGVYSQIASAVFVPRLFVVNGLDDAASGFAHQYEDYQNSEYHRKKDIRIHLDTLNLALRDGTSYTEILWEERISRRRVVTMEPDENGVKRKTVTMKEVTDYRGPVKTSVEYRDLVLSPATAKNPDHASAVYRRLYLSEGQLWDMVRAGVLWEDAVEAILSLHSTGQSDLPDGDTATYQQGGTIEPGDEGVTGDDAQSRGLFEVWRVHTNKFDEDHDQVFEELVLFYYDRTPTLLGGNTYKYWMDRRPFAKLAPITRANRNEGFSIAELNRSMQEEANARHNQRGDAQDLQVFPGMYHTASAELETPDTPLGPKARWKVQAPTDVGVIKLDTNLQTTFEEEALLLSYAMKVSGLEAPAVPLPGGSKVPQRMLQAFKTQSNLRVDLMAMETRMYLQDCMEIEHLLNVQYMDDDTENTLGGQGMETLNENGEKVKLPYEALVQNYDMGIAGTQGALDQESRSENVKMLYALLMQNPLVQGNLERVWEITSLVLDDANLPAYTKFIGKKEDAVKQQQAMAQAAKQQHDEQMQLELASHSKNPSPAMGASVPPAGQSPQPAMNGAPGGGPG